MKKLALLSVLAGMVFVSSCKKDPKDTKETKSFEELKTIVVEDFVNKVALPQYKSLDEAATQLQQDIQNLHNNTTEANLTKAKESWVKMRSIWERCEGFLFGPVADNDYDPQMDFWPTNYADMDALLNSSNTLEVEEIENLDHALRGYHPIEYILWGNHGDRLASSITTRQKKYILSLSVDLKNTCNSLYNDWINDPVNFSQIVLTAGNPSNSRFATKQSVYLALVDGMTEICEEVGGNEGAKMAVPYNEYLVNPQNAANSVESPYSGNSLKDFRDNLVGLQNVYKGISGAYAISDLVASKNKELDNKISNQVAEAISSFDNITVYYEIAIGTQRQQIQGVMDKLQKLATTLDEELKPFIVQYITD